MEKFTDFTGVSLLHISRYVMALGVACVAFDIEQQNIATLMGVAYPLFMTLLQLAKWT